MYPTIGTVLEQTTERHPEREAILDLRQNRRVTYEQWNRHVNRLARALADTGVKKGDRVSAVLYNTLELGSLFFACAKLGAVFNPVNYRLSTEEISFILRDAEPKVVVFESTVETQILPIAEREKQLVFWCIDQGTSAGYAQDYWEMVGQAPELSLNIDVDEQDTFSIMYTSGTTGKPKGVMHRHRDLIEQSQILIAVTKLTHRDRGLAVAPMFHVAELHCCFLPRVHIGAGNVLLQQFDARTVLETIQREQVTILFAATTMWNLLLKENVEDFDLSSLRLGLYGAAPMAPSMVRAIHERLGIGLVQAYGMTEMGPAVTFLLPDEQLKKAGSAGKPAIHHEVRVVRPGTDGPSEPEEVLPPGEVGEILVRGTCLMQGYYKREEANRKALYKGWYHSGDLGCLDEDGYLWVVDRMDDMIISGGENIYPREIEDVLYEHPGVFEVAVVGEPDETWGERVVAYVVPKDDALTAEDLDAFLRESDKLSNYKRPRRYVFVEALPKNASGKILRYRLRSKRATSVSVSREGNG